MLAASVSLVPGPVVNLQGTSIPYVLRGTLSLLPTSLVDAMHKTAQSPPGGGERFLYIFPWIIIWYFDRNTKFEIKFLTNIFCTCSLDLNMLTVLSSP